MDKLLEVASQYGVLGLVVLASFWYIYKKDIAHREERKEMTDALQAQHKEALEVTRNNTNVLQEIATIIRSRRE